MRTTHSPACRHRRGAGRPLARPSRLGRRRVQPSRRLPLQPSLPPPRRLSSSTAGQCCKPKGHPRAGAAFFVGQGQAAGSREATGFQSRLGVEKPVEQPSAISPRHYSCNGLTRTNKIAVQLRTFEINALSMGAGEGVRRGCCGWKRRTFRGFAQSGLACRGRWAGSRSWMGRPHGRLIG